MDAVLSFVSTQTFSKLSTDELQTLPPRKVILICNLQIVCKLSRLQIVPKQSTRRHTLPFDKMPPQTLLRCPSCCRRTKILQSWPKQRQRWSASGQKSHSHFWSSWRGYVPVRVVQRWINRSGWFITYGYNWTYIVACCHWYHLWHFILHTTSHIPLETMLCNYCTRGLLGQTYVSAAISTWTPHSNPLNNYYIIDTRCYILCLVLCECRHVLYCCHFTIDLTVQ